MEGNKDECQRCIEIARRSIAEGNTDKARKFLEKAERLFPTRQAKELLAIIEENGGRRDQHASSSSPSPEPNGDAGSGPEPRRRPTASSNASTAGTRTTAGPSSPSSASASVEKDYTSDQLETVKKVRKCKDYYEILGVPKEFDEGTLKKAYRKLALQLHPDKNKAPGASEAFKAVGNAFAVLSDPEKKHKYDLYGADEPETHSRAHRRGHHYHDDYTRGFEADISAEELFNMFFGGGMPGGNVYVHRRNHRAHHGHHHQQSHQQPQESTYTLFVQLMPILLLIVLSLFSSLFVQDSPYSLQQSDKYSNRRVTQRLGTVYYVKPDFLKDYKGSLRQVERNVEEDWISNLRATCLKERTMKENMLWRARQYNDANMFERAKNHKTPSCDKLNNIYANP